MCGWFQARLPENNSDNVFSPLLILQFYSGISKKTIIFQGFRGVNIFKGWWGGGGPSQGWGIEIHIELVILQVGAYPLPLLIKGDNVIYTYLP